MAMSKISSSDRQSDFPTTQNANVDEFNSHAARHEPGGADSLSGTYRKVFPMDLGDPHGWAPNHGSPTFDTYVSPTGFQVLDRAAVLLLADGTRESVSLPFYVPPEITSDWRLRVWWVYSGTATGDVEILYRINSTAAQSEGDDFSNEGSAGATDTTTDPGQDVLQLSEFDVRSETGWRHLSFGTWDNSTLSSGEQIHVLHAELVEV